MLKKIIYEQPKFVVGFFAFIAFASSIFSGGMIYDRLTARALKLEQQRIHQQKVRGAAAALDSYQDEVVRSLNFDIKKFKSYKDHLFNIRLIGWMPKSLECSFSQCGLHYLPVKEEPTAIPQRVFFLDGEVKVSLSSDILSLTDATVAKREPVDLPKVLGELPSCDDAVIRVNHLQYIANNGVSSQRGNYSSATPINKLQGHKPFITTEHPLLDVYQLPWSITGLDESRFLFFTDWLFSAPGLGISGASFVDGRYTFSGVQYCEV